MKFTEAQLEAAILDLMGQEGYPHVLGETLERTPEEGQKGKEPKGVERKI